MECVAHDSIDVVEGSTALRVPVENSEIIPSALRPSTGREQSALSQAASQPKGMLPAAADMLQSRIGAPSQHIPLIEFRPEFPTAARDSL